MGLFLEEEGSPPQEDRSPWWRSETELPPLTVIPIAVLALLVAVFEVTWRRPALTQLYPFSPGLIQGP
jgi:hypothetical protein